MHCMSDWPCSATYVLCNSSEGERVTEVTWCVVRRRASAVAHLALLALWFGQSWQLDLAPWWWRGPPAQASFVTDIKPNWLYIKVFVSISRVRYLNLNPFADRILLLINLPTHILSNMYWVFLECMFREIMAIHRWELPRATLVSKEDSTAPIQDLLNWRARRGLPRTPREKGHRVPHACVIMFCPKSRSQFIELWMLFTDFVNSDGQRPSYYLTHTILLWLYSHTLIDTIYFNLLSIILISFNH